MANLFNADCFDVLADLEDCSMDAIVTDPPYGILKHKIETSIDIPRFFNECDRVLKPNSFIVFFGRQPALTDWNYHALKVFQYKQEIIWYKRQNSSPLGDMGRVFENIMVFTKGSRQFNPAKRSYCDVKRSLAEFNDWGNLEKGLSRVRKFIREKDYRDKILLELDEGAFYVQKEKSNETATIPSGLTNNLRCVREIRTLVLGSKAQNLVSFLPHNKQSFNNDAHNIKHPTVKPIALMEYLLDLTTNPGDRVFDPFLGSGTTGLAAVSMGREFTGAEIDPDYFAIAAQRIDPGLIDIARLEQLSFL